MMELGVLRRQTDKAVRDKRISGSTREFRLNQHNIYTTKKDIEDEGTQGHESSKTMDNRSDVEDK